MNEALAVRAILADVRTTVELLAVIADIAMESHGHVVEAALPMRLGVAHAVSELCGAFHRLDQLDLG
jgi:hypothetical protein